MRGPPERDTDRLGRLAVRVPRDDGPEVLVGDIGEALDQVEIRVDGLDQHFSEVHPGVRGNLVVAGPGGVHPAAGVEAEALDDDLFDVEVHVLELGPQVQRSVPVVVVEPRERRRDGTDRVLGHDFLLGI